MEERHIISVYLVREEGKDEDWKIQVRVAKGDEGDETPNSFTDYLANQVGKVVASCFGELRKHAQELDKKNNSDDKVE